MLLEIKDLHIVFNVRGGHVYAVNGISFSLDESETVGIIGESGCGKSVTCKAILQLNDVSEQFGQIMLDGRDLMTIGESCLQHIRGKDISLIPQNSSSALNPLVTIGKQITEVIQLHQGLCKTAANDIAVRLLTELNVPDAERKMNEYSSQQSIGINQRVLIAMALSCKPRLIIADEPTASLDSTIQKQMLNIFKALKNKTALLIVSHDLTAIREIADRIIVMYRGQIMEAGATENIFRHPLHPYTKALIACSPYGQEDITLSGEPPSSMLPPIGCPFAGRCQHVVGDICKTNRPVLSELKNQVYCHLYSSK